MAEILEVTDATFEAEVLKSGLPTLAGRMLMEQGSRRGH